MGFLGAFFASTAGAFSTGSGAAATTAADAGGLMACLVGLGDGSSARARAKAANCASGATVAAGGRDAAASRLLATVGSISQWKAKARIT
jgi:hypothetical protein